jgi:alanyl-tRNA synthetase
VRLRRHRVAAAPDMAQAGGTQPENLAKALAVVTDWVKAKL